MVDAQIKYYDSVQYDMVNKVFKDRYGFDMEKVENYFPMNQLDFNGLNDDGVLDAKRRAYVRQRVKSGFSIDRNNSESGFKSLDYFDAVTKNAQQTTYYIAWDKQINYMNRVFSDANFKSTMEKTNPGLHQSLQSWIDSCAKGKPPKAGAFDEVVSTFRNVASVAMLGLRLTPVLVQVPYGLFSRYATPLRWNLQSTTELS